MEMKKSGRDSKKLYRTISYGGGSQVRVLSGAPRQERPFYGSFQICGPQIRAYGFEPRLAKRADRPTVERPILSGALRDQQRCGLVVV